MDLITNIDTTIFPYNDDDMVYDLDSRQYLLTIKGVKSLLGFNLETLVGTPQLALSFCLQNSDIIYNHIYSYSQLQAIGYRRYCIAKDGDLRYMFKRILSAQMRYLITSGANLLGDMHGVNIEKSKALSLNQLRGDVEISSQALKMLSQTGLLFGGYQYVYDYDDDGSF
jgi:hypothetical protein